MTDIEAFNKIKSKVAGALHGHALNEEQSKELKAMVDQVTKTPENRADELKEHLATCRKRGLQIDPALLGELMFIAYNERSPNPWLSPPRWEECGDQVRDKWAAAALASIEVLS